MSQSNQGFFSDGNNQQATFGNGNTSNTNFQDFNHNNKENNNRRSVITVNWEKEVDNVFMDEIGKLSKQCEGGFKF